MPGGDAQSNRVAADRPARLPNDPPRAAYLHVPFCRHRCGYCNFTLVAGRDDLIEPFLGALERELSSVDGVHELDTLYFGGGTPTHLPPAALERLFRMVGQRFRLAGDAEFTVEANPLDLDDGRVADLQSAGVNRLSLGVQSFNDRKLAVLERDHRQRDIARSLQQGRRVTDNVSLDLIFAAPNETLAEWERDLDHAIAAAPEHLSVYGLTIEAGAPFFGRLRRGTLQPVAESLEAEMYELAIDRLAAAGYEQYEVSSFSRAGRRSRHNATYWRGESYFAFGPGAASYVRGRRDMNHRSTTAYIERLLAGRSPVAETEQLAPEDRARERLVFGLRMLDGLSPQEFATDTGFRLDDLAGREIEELVGLELFEWRNERLALTRRGLLVSDSVWPRLLRH
jgi:oxygen-independent coproporphyrinogen III oxidase